MSELPAFNLQSASTSDKLMDELEKFIVFWLGPRREEHGEPQSKLDALRLPKPLRRLYSFAGRWQQQHPQAYEQIGVFSCEDGLRQLEHLEWSDDGKLIFLDENQAVWTCATLTDGDDPPVWVEDVFEEYEQGKWGLVTESLSRFLVTFCLRGMLYGSKYCLHDKAFERLWDASSDERTSLWLDGDYTYSARTCSFYLIGSDILVLDERGSRTFATKTEHGRQYLADFESEIFCLSLSPSPGIGWSLTIKMNGAAEIGLPNHSDSSANTPIGIFDFADVRDRLLAACTEDEVGAHWCAYFHRSGQAYCSGKSLNDDVVGRAVFRTAFEAITSKESRFDKFVAECPLPL